MGRILSRNYPDRVIAAAPLLTFFAHPYVLVATTSDKLGRLQLASKPT